MDIYRYDYLQELEVLARRKNNNTVVACVAGIKRGGEGGREKSSEGNYPLSPIPFSFSLPPYSQPRPQGFRVFFRLSFMVYIKRESSFSLVYIDRVDNRKEKELQLD